RVTGVQIDRAGQRAAAERPNLGGPRLAGRRLALHDRHVGALAREAQADGAAHARARDDRYASIQLAHELPPRRVPRAPERLAVRPLPDTPVAPAARPGATPSGGLSSSVLYC